MDQSMKPNVSFLESMREAIESLNAGGIKQATEAIQRAIRHESSLSVQNVPFLDRSAMVSGGFKRAFGTDMQADAPSALRPVAEYGRTIAFTFANVAGERPYRLYIPPVSDTVAMPLVVMLHGCTQDAESFATATRMNQFADHYGCLIAYPTQPQSANPSKCWNWFNPADQRRESGEPSILAGITRQIIAEYPVDSARVYVAGLSAGGAMAAILVSEYPELFAAAGVHSGLPPRCARDLPTALAAMKGGRTRGVATENKPRSQRAPQRPMIVFHGDADTTVSIKNATLLLDGFAPREGVAAQMSRVEPGARPATVQQFISATGQHGELWTIHGGAHAWSGGDPRASYTDPTGPDATAEMVRFFLAHPKARSSN